MILFHNRNGNSWKIETKVSEGMYEDIFSYVVELSVAGSNHEAFGYKWVNLFYSKNLGTALEQAVRYIDLMEEKTIKLNQPAQLLRADDV